MIPYFKVLDLPVRKAITIAAVVSATFLSSPEVSLSEEQGTAIRLPACPAESNCVSSSFNEPPNRYLSPLKIVNDRDESFRRAVRDLNIRASSNEVNIVEISPSVGYIHLTVPGTSPGSLDDIELSFPEGGEIINVKATARVTLPPPPFCIKKNCINGNMDQRIRAEKIANILGLPPVDDSAMREQAKWTPIFFNSDVVPGFDED